MILPCLILSSLNLSICFSLYLFTRRPLCLSNYLPTDLPTSLESHSKCMGNVQTLSLIVIYHLSKIRDHCRHAHTHSHSHSHSHSLTLTHTHTHTHSHHTKERTPSMHANHRSRTQLPFHTFVRLEITHPSRHTPHSTLYTPHSTLHTPHSTLYTPHSTLHTLHSTLYTPHSTL